MLMSIRLRGWEAGYGLHGSGHAKGAHGVCILVYAKSPRTNNLGPITVSFRSTVNVGD